MNPMLMARHTPMDITEMATKVAPSWVLMECLELNRNGMAAELWFAINCEFYDISLGTDASFPWKDSPFNQCIRQIFGC